MREIFAKIRRPTLVLDQRRAERNIRRMAKKAADSGVSLRPHFKTHQSAAVGEGFRTAGVRAITVSSVEMAEYFADQGWHDITIAFPANVRQLEEQDQLAGRVNLNLLLESTETANVLGRGLSGPVNVWIKVDTGYARTGISWDDADSLNRLAAALEAQGNLSLEGLLTHAGHTYKADTPERIAEIFVETAERLASAQGALARRGRHLALSVGDTPGCSIVPSFQGVDEVRPGNFVFYDLSQWTFGACVENDIAVAVACPIVAKHPARGELVIYGGAVHLSKESLVGKSGVRTYGGVALPTDEGWSSILPDSRVTALSQEHGVVQADQKLIDRMEIGDLLMILPVHSCLTANLLGEYLTLTGELLPMARI